MRHSRIPNPTTSRGPNWLRLMSMVTMLCLLVMLMIQFRDPSMWKWTGLSDSDDDPAATAQQTDPAQTPAAKPQAPEAKPEQPAAKPEEAENKPEKAEAKSEPPESKPEQPATDAGGQLASAPIDVGTDLDPDEMEGFREEVQALEDRSLFIRKEEMEAYDRLVRWVAAQPFDSMRARARNTLRFNDFMQNPEECRGQLVRFKLNCWRLQKCDKKTRDGYQLYELWASTDQSGVWLYDTIILDLPEQMPVRDRIVEQAYFVGYFLKLQGYYPAAAAVNSRPLYAPMLIGRIERVVTPTPGLHDTDQRLLSFVAGLFGKGVSTIWVWMGIAGVGCVVIFAVQFGGVFGRKKRKPALTLLEKHAAARSDPDSVEAWIDRVDAGDHGGGNNSSLRPELVTGTPGGNGDGPMESQFFRDGLDQDRPGNE